MKAVGTTDITQSMVFTAYLYVYGIAHCGSKAS